MSKAKLWIIYYCILEMEADNEPAISLPKSHYIGLPVYFEMKICYTKKQNKTKGQETKKGKFSSARVEPRTSALSIAPRQLQSTPDNSNLQGKSKIVRVIGSSSYRELEDISRE